MKKNSKRKTIYRQVMFDFDLAGNVRQLVDDLPKSDGHESCPGCNAPMQRRGACRTCQRCGYKSCGGE